MNKALMWYIALIWLALLLICFEEGWTILQYLTYAITQTTLIFGGILLYWKYTNIVK